MDPKIKAIRRQLALGKSREWIMRNLKVSEKDFRKAQSTMTGPRKAIP